MTIDFRETTLDNGLTIIAEMDPAAHTAAMGFFVRTGARDEASKLMGVSHFLEHMMFKGTERRTAAQVDLDFDTVGAQHNAFTTSEMTAFWAHALPEHLDRIEEILSDIMRPAIRPEDFNDEKKVILEEIAMYRDHPFWSLYEGALEAYYRDHPLHHRVLGTEESITNLERDAMVAYFEDRYSADNTTVAIAGRVDFDAIVARIEAHCGHWHRTDTTRAHPRFTPAPADLTMKSETVRQHYLLMLTPAPPRDDDRRYAASMLMQILGDVDGSRLYWSLVETGLAEEAQAQHDGRDGVGEFLVYCASTPENAEEVERVARAEIETLVESITQDDLERVQAKVATAATLHGELPSGRMRRLGRLWTYTGRYRSLEEEVERMNRVTVKDLRDLADAYPLAPMVAARLTPAEAE